MRASLILFDQDCRTKRRSARNYKYMIYNDSFNHLNHLLLVKLWNLVSGKQEKTLLAYSDEEITQCVILPNASLIFMLGWCKKILAYKNTSLHKKVFIYIISNTHFLLHISGLNGLWLFRIIGKIYRLWW